MNNHRHDDSLTTFPYVSTYFFLALNLTLSLSLLRRFSVCPSVSAPVFVLLFLLLFPLFSAFISVFVELKDDFSLERRSYQMRQMVGTLAAV